LQTHHYSESSRLRKLFRRPQVLLLQIHDGCQDTARDPARRKLPAERFLTCTPEENNSQAGVILRCFPVMWRPPSPCIPESGHWGILDVYLGKQWNLFRGLRSSAPQCGHLILDRLISSSVRSRKHFSHLTMMPVLRLTRPLVSSMRNNAPLTFLIYLITFLAVIQFRPLSVQSHPQADIL